MLTQELVRAAGNPFRLLAREISVEAGFAADRQPPLRIASPKAIADQTVPPKPGPRYGRSLSPTDCDDPPTAAPTTMGVSDPRATVVVPDATMYTAAMRTAVVN
jgi:hypothetical protein